MYKKRKGRKQKRPSKELFEYQYYILDMSAQEMAEIHNVKEHTIYNWANYYRKKEN